MGGKCGNKWRRRAVLRTVSRGCMLAAALVGLARGGEPPVTAPASSVNPAGHAAGRTIVIPINGDIDLGLAPFVERVLQEASADDFVVFEINTFGGRIDAAVVIRDAVLGSRAKTAALVNKRAISAGALIALATDTIVMTTGATMGAATPVQIEGGKMAPVEAKVISYMRKEMKATAEAKHRRGDIAEAMVDASVVIEGLDGKETTLTLTTEEALKFNYAAFSAESVSELCTRLSRPQPVAAQPVLNWAERVARVLSDPAISSLLMTLGMLGLMLELYAPGHAVAGVLGVTCLVLFFFGHHVVHLAGWGTIILFVAGVMAVVIEVFFWAGHGSLAIVGAIAILTSLVLAFFNWHSVPFEVSLSLGWVTSALARVFGSLMVTMVVMVLASRFLPSTRLGRRFILGAAITDSAGAASSQLPADEVVEALVGRPGVAETSLRPSGKVRIDDRRLDVVAEGGYLDAGTPIEVVSADGSRIVVRRRPG